LHIDVRDIDNDRQRISADELIAAAQRIAKSRGIAVSVELLADASPVILPKSVREVITRAAADVGVSYKVLPSGASHDTQMIDQVCDSGMIFVPSQNHGISHAPEELTLIPDLVRGIDVLIASLRGLDDSADPDIHR
jgi:acetylornithine deacetylase/succinyl-diaminopimelate desuccinylase-like protein